MNPIFANRRERLMEMKVRRKGVEQPRRLVAPPVFDKCSRCGAVAAKAELARSLYVCPNCGYHHPIGAYLRLAMVLDAKSFRELNEGLVAPNALQFPGYEEKLESAVAMLREKNPDAAILTTPWDQLDGKVILSAIEKVSLADELLEKMRAEHAADEAEHEHEHHHHDHDEHEHHHDHDHGEHEHHHDHDDHDHDDHDHEEHEHHHHDHDHECDDPNCSCHHHHHHADEVFTSWGRETPKVFTQADIERILTALDSGDYGKILRAKGIVNGEGGAWIEFDFVPEEHEVRAGHPDYTGRLCVIGAELKEDKLAELFGL